MKRDDFYSILVFFVSLGALATQIIFLFFVIGYAKFKMQPPRGGGTILFCITIFFIVIQKYSIRNIENKKTLDYVSGVLILISMIPVIFILIVFFLAIVIAPLLIKMGGGI